MNFYKPLIKLEKMNLSDLQIQKLKIDIESKEIDIQLKKERLKQMQMKNGSSNILSRLHELDKQKMTPKQKLLIRCLLLFIIGFIVIWFLPNKKQPNPIEKVKQIETRLKPIYQKTVYHEKQANNGKIILSGLNTRFDLINSKFDEFKRQKDTVYILAYCDSIRNDYMKYKQTSSEVIKHLDSANINYKYIIKSKDTIIEIQAKEIQNLSKSNKRLKLQRNISFILNAILGGLLVIK